ncbi:MAG: thioredoxin family protein [Acetobacterales bacterium]
MSGEIVAVVKKECPTCTLVEPVLRQIAETRGLVVWTQDDPAFPSGLPDVRHDDDLERSYRLNVITVPTLFRLEGGREVARAEGWHRGEWQELAGLERLGDGLPDSRPGCGALNVGPGMVERLALRFGDVALKARTIEVSEWDDPIEIAYDRGWSDGLPVVPPTDLRIARMLAGTTRKPHEVVGLIPPNLNECTVEKAAINAVMAGCRPEYFPVVLSAIEAALLPAFSMHGLLCTLNSAGPLVIVNGPVAKRIGMNWQGNALGQGNRANATIGRALQLVIRNVGGGRPQEIDRSVMGNPGKYTFCFAEDETDPEWTPLSVARGHAPGVSTVTLFHAEGPSGFSDQKSRTPEELTRSLAMGLWRVTHPKAPVGISGGAVLVLSPDHYSIYQAAGWGREKIEDALFEAMLRPASEVARGVGGAPTGADPALGDTPIGKLPRENFLLVRAGGRGGLNSSIIGGWTGQRNPKEVTVVSKEIGE